MAKLPAEYHNQKGQAVLMIVLVLSVVLTLVVSAVTRSVVDLDVVKYDDNAVRAFDAAQAGIERTLIGESVPVGDSLTSGAEVTVSTSDTSNTSSQNTFRYPIELYSGESAVFWFVNHKETASGDLIIDCGSGGCTVPNSIRFCWGEKGTTSSDAEAPALVIEYYHTTISGSYKYDNLVDFSNINVIKVTADPKSSRRSTNNFDAPNTITGIGCSNTDVDFAFSGRYNRGNLAGQVNYSNTAGSLIMVRVTMVYNTSKPHPIGIRFSGNLPPQGKKITSVGESGDAVRKLSLYQGYPEFPFEFGSVIYSKGSVAKP